MVSPGTIILLIVDYHAAIRGQDPRGPTVAYSPVDRPLHSVICPPQREGRITEQLAGNTFTVHKLLQN